MRRLLFGQINTATTPVEGVKRNNGSSNNNTNANQLVPNVPSVIIDE